MNEREVKDFFFKQLRKVAVGDPAVPNDRRVSLLACSSHYGLTFLATRAGVCVFETAVLAAVDKAHVSGSKNTLAELSSLQPMQFSTPSPPLHLSLSSDSLTLCLAWRINNILSLNFYDTRAVVQAKSSPVQPFCSISPNTQSGVGVCGAQWNPCSPELLAVVLSSGGLYVLEVKEDVKVIASDAQMGAACLCWSPKGKQLALGMRDGSIMQYSHKSCAVKHHHLCPDAFSGVPHQVTDVHWLSTYMFAAVYTPTSGSNHTPISLFLSTPKNSPVTWSEWGDVYYGGTSRADKFYFTHLAEWNILLTSSANALETVVFSQLEEGWERWELEDSGRAETPLADGEETHVVGMALSMCSQCDVQISDTLVVPPSPLLLLYSTAGVLCPFWIVHHGKSREDLAAVVRSPTALPPGPPRTSASPTTSAPPQLTDMAGVVPQPSTAPTATPCTESQQMPATPALTPNMTIPTFSVPTGPSGQRQAWNPNLPLLSFQQQNYRSPAQYVIPPTTVGTLPQAARPPLPSTVGTPPQSVHPPLPSTVGTPPQSVRPPLPSTVGTLPQAVRPPLPSTFGTPPQSVHPPLPSTVGTPPQSVRPPLPSTVGTPPQFVRPPLPSTFGTPLQAVRPLLPSTVGTLPQAVRPPLPSTVGTPLQAVRPPLPSTVGTPLQAVRPPLPSTVGTLPQAVRPPLPSTVGTPPQTVRPPLPSTVGTPLQAVRPPLPSTVGTPLQAVRPPLPSTVGTPLQAVRPPLPSTVGTLPQAVRPPLPSTVGTPPQAVCPPLPSTVGTLLHAVRPPPPPLQSVQYSGTQATCPAGSPLAGTVRPNSSHLTRPAITSGVLQARPQQATQSPSGSQALSSQAVPRPPLRQPSTSSPATTAQRVTAPAQGSPPREDTQNVEVTFSAHIAEEIDRFADELEGFKEDVISVLGAAWEEGEGEGEEEGVKSIGELGTLQDAVEVREETEEVGSAVWEAVTGMKELSSHCDQLQDEVLRGLELCEKARVSVKKTSDREHAVRQKVRPLDPANMRKLQNIRKMFLEVDQKIGEVNGQLDAEIQRRRMDSLQKGRSPLRPPSIQTVYSTLRDHNKILKFQEDRAAKIAGEMKRLRFIPPTWTPEDAQQATPPDRRVTPMVEREESEGGRAPQPQKLDKLREYLRNIDEIPVCRLRPKPFVRPATSDSSSEEANSVTPEPSEDASYIGSGSVSSTTGFLISGSTAHLYKKAESRGVFERIPSQPATPAQASSTSLAQAHLPQPNLPAQPLSSSTLAPLQIPTGAIQHPAPPRASSSGSIGQKHTVAWGCPPPTCSASLSAVNVEVASHEGTGVLRRVEGQPNLAASLAASLQRGTVQPTANTTPLVPLFSSNPSLSRLSPSGPAGAVPPTSISGLVANTEKSSKPSGPSLPISSVPSSQSSGLLVSSKPLGGQTTTRASTAQGALFTFGLPIAQSTAPATKLVTAGSQSLKTGIPHPSTSATPFVFSASGPLTTAPTRVVDFTPPTFAQPPVFSPATSFAAPQPPTTTSPEDPTSMAQLGTSTASFSPSSLTLNLQYTATQHIPASYSTSVPPLTAMTSTSLPVTAMTSTSLPVTAVTSTSLPVTSTSLPVTAVTSTSLPVTSTSLPVTSTSLPVTAVTSTSLPVTSTSLPVTAVTSTSLPVTSTSLPVTVVTSSSLPVPVTVVTSSSLPVTTVTSIVTPVTTSLPVTSTGVVSTTSPVASLPASSVPTVVTSVTTTSIPLSNLATSSVATSGDVSTPGDMPGQVLGSATGPEELEMEDDMEQADLGLQPTPASTGVGGTGGLFGGLGGLNIGGPPQTSSLANPFGSFTPMASSTGSTTTTASPFTSGGVFGGGLVSGGALQSLPTFSSSSQPLFGQSPTFGQSSLFGASASIGKGATLGGGPPSFNVGGMMFGGSAAGTAKTESVSFGSLASQTNIGFTGSDFSLGTGGTFGNPPMTGSSFSSWR